MTAQFSAFALTPLPSRSLASHPLSLHFANRRRIAMGSCHFLHSLDCVGLSCWWSSVRLDRIKVRFASVDFKAAISDPNDPQLSLYLSSCNAEDIVSHDLPSLSYTMATSPTTLRHTTFRTEYNIGDCPAATLALMMTCKATGRAPASALKGRQG